jgi:hypothetical protein
LFIPTLNEDSTAFTPIIRSTNIWEALLKIRAKKIRFFDIVQSLMSHITKSISGALSFLLLVTLISFGISPSANAAALPDGSYKCSNGVKDGGSPSYTITDYVVTNGSACTGAVVIPSGVTEIGADAFAVKLPGDGLITSITIPNTVASIGQGAFIDQIALASLTIPNSVTSIGASAFSGLSSMTELTISNSLTSISASAFSVDSSLETLSIPNSVISIGDAAFFNTTSLTSLYIPNSVISIGDYAFLFTTSLTTLIIPNSVTSIGGAAFASATSLTTLTIPNSVTSIGAGAFSSTTSLTQYTYCGTALSQDQLDAAFLNGKTRISICSITAPGAPTIGTATATGKRSATISFTAPASNGGSVITSYTATSTPGGITKTLTQAGGGTFTFDTLQPGTSYTFAVTATNNIGTSVAATSNSIKTMAADVASIASLTFSDDGSGTAGKIAWAGKNIDSVLYTGPSSTYPGPFNYGAFTSGWNGTIRNLTPETSYTISIFAVSIDGVGESKSLTFKTGAKADVVKNLAYWNVWLKSNTFLPNEADNLISLLNKFNALETSSYRSYFKVPTSRVSTVVATSLTPKSCSVIATTAKVDAGLVKALTKAACTISYTVSGGSKAPATLVKDFVFKKVG